MFLNLGFSNEWWNLNYGIDFSEETYLDPLKKALQQDQMNSIMAERFAKWGFLGNIDSTATLSRPSVAVEPYGHRFIPAMFGAPVNYKYNQAPWAITTVLDKDFIMSNKPISEKEFSESQPVREIARQCCILRDNARECSAQQNMGSVMNTAIYLRGQDLFLDFDDSPEMVRKLFSLITNMMLVSYEYFCKIDRQKSPLGVGNCSVAMLSPRIYEEFVLPYDMEIMKYAKVAGVPFMIHQDSKVDPFIKSYKKFNYLVSFDIGCDTDVKSFRREFPDINLNVFVYTSLLHEKNEKELYDFFLSVAENGAPLGKIGFSVFDVDNGVPMSKIESICNAFAHLKSRENSK